MVCSKPFTFPYWFSHLRTRQKQLSLAPKISVYSRRGIVNGKVLKWPETCQIMSWSWLSAWNWVVFFHMLWHWSRQLYYRTKLYERKETGRAEMFFIWFVTSWTHTFIMAWAITITYQRTNTLKYLIIQMGPLLSLHLLLTVIGTMLFHLSCLGHYSSNKRPMALLPTAILTFFPLHWAFVGKIPVHLSALYWTCDAACKDWCDVGMKDSARVAMAVPMLCPGSIGTAGSRLR